MTNIFKSPFFHRLQLFLVLFFIVATTCAVFIPKFKRRSALVERRKEILNKIDETEDEIENLRKRELAFKNNPGHLEKLARDKMGYSRPDEIIYKFD